MDLPTEIDETSRRPAGPGRAQADGLRAGLAGLVLTAAMLVVADRGEVPADRGNLGEASAALG
jgi:hypothetical protein